MKPIYRRLLIFVVALVVIAGGYFGYRLYVASQGSLPSSFMEARSEGAVISERIVSNSNDIAAYVGRLSSPTSTAAIVSSTIGEVTIKVSEVRSQALELAATIDVMLRAVPDIRSEEAQQIALEAADHRLELVEHLLTYTEEVNRLALAMRLRLQNGIRNNGDIAALIENINGEISAINNLSRKANEAMERLDSLLR